MIVLKSMVNYGLNINLEHFLPSGQRALIYNREALKPTIDKIICPDKEGRFHMKIIAGIPGPCRPLDSECCTKRGNGYVFVHQAPFILAYKGFQADSFML